MERDFQTTVQICHLQKDGREKEDASGLSERLVQYIKEAWGQVSVRAGPSRRIHILLQVLIGTSLGLASVDMNMVEINYIYH